jgi:hypothetical protein
MTRLECVFPAGLDARDGLVHYGYPGLAICDRIVGGKAKVGLLRPRSSVRYHMAGPPTCLRCIVEWARWDGLDR